MKECKVFKNSLCLGCPGLAEKDWCGPEQCKTYQKKSNGLDLCKRILKGE